MLCFAARCRPSDKCAAKCLKVCAVSEMEANF